MNGESAKRIARVRAIPAGGHVHVSGICGTGMAAVATLLKELGFRVTGSDKAFYPPMGDVVRKVADRVFEGYSAENLSERPALVVIGNNLRRDNPEAEHVVREGIPYASMPEVFAALLIGERSEVRTSVVVSGTHGKTTTCAAIATMLEVAGLAPGYFIGGVPKDLPSAVRAASKKQPAGRRVVVLEGDEYDSAYFAKWPKFLSYRPDILIVTSVEFDHADIYDSIEQIEAEFTKVAALVPEEGLILVCEESERAVRLAETWRKTVKARIELYGEPSRETFAGGQRIRAFVRGKELVADSSLSGPQNAQNLLAAAIVLAELEVPHETIAHGIAGFHGVLRRQHVVGDFVGTLVIEDFAHHPTAVQLTLQGIRESYPGRRIICVFEPRSNTTRRGFFQDEYGAAFAAAQLLVLLDIQDTNVYSKNAAETRLLDLGQLASDAAKHGTETHRFPSAAEIAGFLVPSSRPGDVIVCMSNGDFGGLLPLLTAGLRARPASQ